MMRGIKLLAVGSLLLVSTAATIADPEPECVVAGRWAKEHLSSLPRTRDGISQYRLPYRKAAYGNLPREVQLQLWHEQFAYYIALDSLTPTQQEFLVEVNTELDDYFGPDKVSEAKARYQARSREILGDNMAMQVFADLGVNTPEDIAMATELATTGTLAKQGCGCSTGDDWCNPFGLGCGNGTSSCEPAPIWWTPT